jgi:hypothetical protein
MMKLLAGIVVISVFLAKPLRAEDSQNLAIAIQGKAASICVLQPAQATSASNMSLMQGAAPLNAVTIPKLIDAQTAQLLPASISLKFKGLCNCPHSISLQSVKGGMRGAGGTEILEGPFQTIVNYLAKIRWGTAASELLTDGTQGQRTPAMLNGAYSGDLLLDIAVNQDIQGSRPILKNSYYDILIITLGAPL